MTDPFDTDNAIDISRVSTMAGGLEQQLDAPELAAENERLQYELDEQCRLLGAGGEREAKLASDNQRLREALKMLRAAMLRAVDIGCVDHLDCADDHGAFWHNALDTSKEFAS